MHYCHIREAKACSHGVWWVKVKLLFYMILLLAHFFTVGMQSASGLLNVTEKTSENEARGGLT